MSTKLILASASPRRLELLSAAGFRPRVIPSPEEEPTKRPASIPVALWPIYLAFIKAYAVQRTVKADDAIILGADTIVVLDGQILGKPTSESHARKMLASLSGKQHEVITGVALLKSTDHRLFGETATCRIKHLPQSWLDAYLKTGRWKGKAGAYGLQDKGDPFVSLLAGDPTTVIGLPMTRVKAELKTLGAKK